MIFVTLKIAGDDRQEELVQQYLSVYLRCLKDLLNTALLQIMV